jgi:hypothetical protein
MGAGGSVGVGVAVSAGHRDQKQLASLSVDGVCQVLRNIWIEQFERRFRDTKVDGQMLLKLDSATKIVQVLRVDPIYGGSVFAYIKSLISAQTLHQSASFRRASAANAGNELTDFHQSFQLIKCIQKGHFGDVWVAARKTDANDLAAVKIIDKGRRACFYPTNVS